MIKTVKMAALATAVLALVYLGSRYTVVFQEGNPLPLVWGIAVLEFTDADVVPVSDLKLIGRAGPETPLTAYLTERGFHFRTRMGAGILYEREDEELLVIVRMYTRRYVIYELSRPL